jgi:hypothetical protein
VLEIKGSKMIIQQKLLRVREQQQQLSVADRSHLILQAGTAKKLIEIFAFGWYSLDQKNIFPAEKKQINRRKKQKRRKNLKNFLLLGIKSSLFFNFKFEEEKVLEKDFSRKMYLVVSDGAIRFDPITLLVPTKLHICKAGFEFDN